MSYLKKYYSTETGHHLLIFGVEPQKNFLKLTKDALIAYLNYKPDRRTLPTRSISRNYTPCFSNGFFTPVMELC